MAFIYDLTDTWNNAGISFNGIKLNATDTASAAGSKLLDLQIGGASKFTVGKTGSVIATGNIHSTSGGFTFPDGTTQITRAVTNVTATDGSIAITGTTDINLSVVSAPKAYAVTTTVRNNSGATLTKGTAVYINGAIGQNPTVTKAIASGDATSAQTLGLIVNDISNNATGEVILIGTLYNVNTSAYTDGQQLYLSPTTAGTLTTTKPYAPSHLVYMAVVEHSHPSQGKLFVKVQNGYELDELHNVSAQTPSNNHGIFYNTATSLWENKSIVTALGYTPYNSTNPAGYLSSVSLTSNVTGILPIANGGTGATTASGARTALGLGTAAVLNAGVAGGVATLDGSGAVPTSQLPGAVLGGLNYQGTWNASTNTPTLASSTGSKGYYYVVSVAGSTNLNGITDWKIGDWAVYDGTAWQKVDNTDAVSSVNGFTGAVVLTTSDVAQGTNLYFTQAAARGSVSAGTGISYNSTSGVITNSAPDQTVALTGAGTTVVTGTYPNFTITSNDSTVGTVTSVAASGGTTGLSFTGSPITTAGTLTLAGTLGVANGGTGVTTLSSGYLVKGNGTSAVSASVVYDTGTNVGIGTSSPAARLDVQVTGGRLQVQSAVSTTGIRLLPVNAANSATVPIEISGTDIRFTNPLNAVVGIFDANGNLGVGTSSPLTQLNVPSSILVTSDGGYYGGQAYFASGSWRNAVTGQGGYAVRSTAGVYTVWTGASASAAGTAFTDFAERMRITSAGNVGIGTSTPAQKLSVAGTIESTSGGVIVPDQLAYDYATSNLPTTRPALLLDFADVGALDPRITFTRASTATFTGSNGLIQTAAINAPRFEYDPVTLAAKGLLIEEQRTNLFTYSDQFDNAAWAKGVGYNSTISANTAVAPDGTTTADSVVADNAGGTGTVILARSVSITSGTSYTLTFFAKANTLSWIRLFALGYTSPANGGAYFNLSGAGAVGTVDSGYTASITAFANGWYRCTLSFTAGSTATGELRLLLANANNDTAVARNGTSSVYAWGAQLETSTFATSYIPTVASQVTRTADVTSIVAPNFAPWYNQSAGTFVFEGTVFTTSGFTWPLIASDSTINEAVAMYRSGGGVAGFIRDNITTQMEITSSPVVVNVPFKMAVAAQANDGNFSFNGNIGSTDTTITMPTVTRLFLGANANGNAEYLNGHIRQIAYYNTRLPNAVLQGITS